VGAYSTLPAAGDPATVATRPAASATTAARATATTATTATATTATTLPAGAGGQLFQVGLGQVDLAGRVGRQGRPLLLREACPVRLVLPRADDVHLRHVMLLGGTRGGPAKAPGAADGPRGPPSGAAPRPTSAFGPKGRSVTAP